MDRSAEDTNGGRLLKRRRIEDNNGNNTQTSSLPSEVLGNIMNFLDYTSVLSCAATSKSLLHAMSLITTLHIDKSSELNALSSRYRDVTVINICSLFRVEGNTRIMVDAETVMKAVLFLSRFTKLEKVLFGGIDNNGKKFGLGEAMGTPRSIESTSSLYPPAQLISMLVDQISNAFQSNFLPKHLLVLGIRCISRNQITQSDSDCPCCQLACKTWPLEHVINFNNKGSSRRSKDMFEQRRPNTLDVCLTRDQLETIVKGRSGGEELLCPERRLLHLLGNGRLHIIRSDDDGSPFYIVQLDVDILKEEITKVNGKQLSKEDVTKAIMNSFSINGGAIPPKSRCYLGRGSSYGLENIGLTTTLDDALVIHNMNLPHIIKVLLADGVEHWALISDCLYLLLFLLKQKGNISAVQHIVDSGLLPLFINKYMNSTHSSKSTIGAVIAGVALIIDRGPITVTETLLELGLVQKLLHVLSEEHDFPPKAAIKVLERIARKSTSSRDIVLKTDLVVPLTTLLQGKKSVEISRAVSYLIHALCQGEPRPDFAAIEPYLSVIPSILLVNDKRTVKCCGKALLVLCELDEQRAVDSTCKILMELLANNSEIEKFNAMKCIIMLIDGNEAILDHLMNSDLLSIVVPLMSNTNPSIPTLVLGTLALRIGCIVSKKYARQVVSSGCIHIFFGLLISSDHDTVKYSVIALLRILEFGREEGDQSITSVICSGLSLIETKLGELDFSMGYKHNITEEEVQMYKKNMPLYKAL